MSDETQAALDQARASQDAAAARLAAAQDALLEQVAANAPARIEAMTKELLNRAPRRAQELGREGIQRLRAEVLAGAAELADGVRVARDAVKWPSVSSFGVGPFASSSGVVGYIEQNLMKHVRAPLSAAGFNPHSGEFGAQALLGLRPGSSRSDDESLADLVEAADAALEEHADAARETARAQATHDRAAIDDMWG